MPSDRPFKLPSKATGTQPGAITPKAWNEVIGALESLHATQLANTPRSGSDIGIRKNSGGAVPYLKQHKGHRPNTQIPFAVTLYKEAGPAYKVTVGWGYVREHIPGPDDALIYHEPANKYDPEDVTLLRKFPITVGQAVYIRREIDANGNIAAPDEETDAVSIHIAADDQPSNHYEPKVDDQTSSGAAGYYLTKLVVLKSPVSPSTTPTLEKWSTGSHIDHYQELPSILSTAAPTAGIGCIIKQWSNSLRAYLVRALTKGLGKNNITTQGDLIEVRGTMKDANVAIWYGNGPRPSPEIEWSDGYMSTGTNIVGDEETPPDPLAIDIKIPIVIAWDDPEAQITVTNIGAAGGTVYEVRGNAVTGKLTYTIGAGSAVDLIEWKDGLVVSGGDINIPMPEGGGSALPSGSEGDMLYHDGESWVVLASPGAPTSGYEHVMHHDGFAPSWHEYEKVVVQICVSGTPQEYTILGFPSPPP